MREQSSTNNGAKKNSRRKIQAARVLGGNWRTEKKLWASGRTGLAIEEEADAVFSNLPSSVLSRLAELSSLTRALLLASSP